MTPQTNTEWSFKIKKTKETPGKETSRERDLYWVYGHFGSHRGRIASRYLWGRVLSSDFEILKNQGGVGLVVAGSLTAFIGAFIGRRLLKKITMRGPPFTICLIWFSFLTCCQIRDLHSQERFQISL